MSLLHCPSPGSRFRCRPNVGGALWLVALVFLLNPGSLVAEDGFSEDAEAALKQAAEEQKDLLLLFTGSDWCPPCQRLETEVLSKDEFLDEIQKTFVLVKFDYPRTAPQDPEIKEQNRIWAEKFGIGSFPTVILADASNRPYAFAGYQDGGVPNYLAMLESQRQKRVFRDQKLAEAAQAEGAQRAQLLDAAISDLGEAVVSVYYQDIVEEIVALDSDNALGLRGKWNAAADAEMRKVVMTDLLMMSRIGKPAAAMQLIDDVLDEIQFTDAEKLTIYQIKLNLARELKQPEVVDAVLDQMISLEGVLGDTRQRLVAKKVYLMAGDGRREEALQLLQQILAENPGAGHLHLAQGQLLASAGDAAGALAALQAGLNANVSDPDLVIDLVAAKADLLFDSQRPEDALQTLDDFADNTNFPSELRAEVLLQKAMMMREMGRSRQARLAENRAIDVAESAAERATIEKMVQQLRKREDSDQESSDQ